MRFVLLSILLISIFEGIIYEAADASNAVTEEKDPRLLRRLCGRKLLQTLKEVCTHSGF